MENQSFKESRVEVLERDNKECQFCGVSNEQHKQDHGKGLHVHHIIPRSAGGSNHPSNLLSVCTSCHKTIESTQAKALTRIKDEYTSNKIAETQEEYEQTIDSLIQTIHILARGYQDLGWLVHEYTTSSVDFYMVLESFGDRTHTTTDRDKAIESFDGWGDTIKKNSIRLQSEQIKEILSDLESRNPTQSPEEIEGRLR